MGKKSFLMATAAVCGIFSSVSLRGQDSLFKVTDSTLVLDLQGTVCSAQIASREKSPLRLKDIKEKEIRALAAGKTFPELIHNVPGVYATSESGSFGDAKINIRGFKQENISVLLNGIPISGLTSGSMYWNNWMGLSDATGSIQLQKGIGNSMLSDNSVGGTINILTTQPQSVNSSSLGWYGTSYGTQGVNVKINSGNLGKGWSFVFAGSHNYGKSYADMTDLSTWSYYLSVTKVLNEHNIINFTGLGSPETHDQRSQRLTVQEVSKYGRNYNKNWGWMTDSEGKTVARTLSENTYFKPYFTLTHDYKSLGEKGLRINSTIYAAVANGGGFYTESNGKRIAQFTDVNGQIDWDAAIRSNSIDGRAMNIMSDYLAGHKQLGLKSTALLDLTDRIRLETGLHYQFYSTWEKERITDLLGAEFWLEESKGTECQVGDYIRINNGRFQHYSTVYALGTITLDKDIFSIGMAGNSTSLQRWDEYNYSGTDVYSDWATKSGGSIKAGYLHRINSSCSVYANAAAYSRAPYANVFFASGNNQISEDVVNEKNLLSELGLRHTGQKGSLEITAYYAYWKDKTLLSAPYKSVDVDPVKYMVKGLDARHCGIELEGMIKPLSWFAMNGFASLGNWTWANDVQAVIYDPYTMQSAGEVKVYADGLHVGDAPQTQIGGSVDIDLRWGFSLTVDDCFNDRLYADFDPVSRSSEEDRSESYRIPSYNLLNARLTWTGTLGKYRLEAFCNGNNLLDAYYIERSKDGSDHTLDTLSGFWGAPRSLTFGLRLFL